MYRVRACRSIRAPSGLSPISEGAKKLNVLSDVVTRRTFTEEADRLEQDEFRVVNVHFAHRVDECLHHKVHLLAQNCFDTETSRSIMPWRKQPYVVSISSARGSHLCG